MRAREAATHAPIPPTIQVQPASTRSRENSPVRIAPMMFGARVIAGWTSTHGSGRNPAASCHTCRQSRRGQESRNRHNQSDALMHDITPDILIQQHGRAVIERSSRETFLT